MAKRFVFLAPVLILCSTGVLAQFKQQTLPARRYAAPHDTAIGEVVSETEDRLELNLRPCDASKSIVEFRKPFVKTSATAVSCAGVSISQWQLIQH